MQYHSCIYDYFLLDACDQHSRQRYQCGSNLTQEQCEGMGCCYQAGECYRKDEGKTSSNYMSQMLPVPEL